MQTYSNPIVHHLPFFPSGAHCDSPTSALKLWPEGFPRKVTSNWRMRPRTNAAQGNNTFENDVAGWMDGWVTGSNMHKPGASPSPLRVTNNEGCSLSLSPVEKSLQRREGNGAIISRSVGGSDPSLMDARCVLKDDEGFLERKLHSHPENFYHILHPTR